MITSNVSFASKVNVKPTRDNSNLMEGNYTKAGLEGVGDAINLLKTNGKNDTIDINLAPNNRFGSDLLMFSVYEKDQPHASTAFKASNVPPVKEQARDFILGMYNKLKERTDKPDVKAFFDKIDA